MSIISVLKNAPRQNITKYKRYLLNKKASKITLIKLILIKKEAIWTGV